MLRLLSFSSSVALCGVLLLGGASAHDPTGKGGLPPKYVQRVTAAMQGLIAADDSDEAKGVFGQLSEWPPSYAKLRVCFMGGSPSTNSEVARIASQWINESSVGLKLDFGNSDSPRECDPKGRASQIRVSYDQPGDWSMIGQNSVVFAEQGEPTLNLEGLDRVDPELLALPEAQGLILHEFGHALGLLHEHQSPAAVCVDEFDWNYIIEKLSGPPNNWDEETIRDNMAPEIGDDLMMTEFDPKSIMIYAFPPEFFLHGKESVCYIGKENTQISEGDRTTIRYMYPSDYRDAHEEF